MLASPFSFAYCHGDFMTTPIAHRFFTAALIMAALGLNISPAHAESEALRPDIGKPLQAAQELMKNKKYREALAKVHEAEAVPNRTAYENFILDRMRGAAASAAGDTELAAKSFNAVINSGKLPAAEQLQLIEAMTGIYYRAKDYGQAAAWAQRYLKINAGNAGIRTLLIQSQYLQGNYADAARELSAEFREDDKAGRVPTEERVRLLASCYLQLKDTSGYVSALERLVAHYPKKEYWGDLLAHVQRKPGFADRLALDLYRLQLATGNLTSTNHFMEMAQLALQAGYPAEAKKVVDKGFESGALGAGADAERHKRLRNLVNKKAAEDVKALGEGDSQAEAANNGIALVNIGYNYVANGKFAKGISMMERGIVKGGLKRPDDALLHLVEAHVWAGNKTKAAQTLKSVQGTDGTADLARLWAYVR